MLEGVETSERFTTYGPFLTTLTNLLDRTTVNQVEVGWRAFPDFGTATLDRCRRPARPGRGTRRPHPGATGGAPARHRHDRPAGDPRPRPTQSLLVSRAGVLVLTIQLVILAVYAVLLSAALLVEHRRIDTAMLRSRGAGPSRIAGMAAAEGAVLVVAAVSSGRGWRSGRCTCSTSSDRWPTSGCGSDPVVGRDAYLAAAAAGVLCLIALTLPAFLSARSLARRPGRDGARSQPTRGSGALATSRCS